MRSEKNKWWTPAHGRIITFKIHFYNKTKKLFHFLFRALVYSGIFFCRRQQESPVFNAVQHYTLNRTTSEAKTIVTSYVHAESGMFDITYCTHNTYSPRGPCPHRIDWFDEIEVLIIAKAIRRLRSLLLIIIIFINSDILQYFTRSTQNNARGEKI